MKRAISIWLPMLPIDVFRRRRSRRSDLPPIDSRHEHEAILLHRKDGQREIVAHCCENALDAGVRPDMPLGQARSVIHSPLTIIAHPATPQRDTQILKALAAWALRFSPIISIDEPDGLLIDASGCPGVFGGEPRMARLILEGFTALGFRCTVAIAPTFRCAWAVARHTASPIAIVPDGLVEQALAPLPVCALRIEPDAQRALAEVGVERIEHLLRLPRSALPARFGDALLMRIDQALGQAMEMLQPVRPVPPTTVERLLDGPTIDLTAINLTIEHLLEALAAHLQSSERGVRRLEVALHRSDLDPALLTLALSRPTRDHGHLMRLLRPRIERLHLGYGVERITLTAAWTALLRHEQMERWTEHDARDDPEVDRAAAELIDTLANRFGADRVRRAALIPSHIPERAFRLIPASDDAPVSPRSDASSPSPPDRPALLFPRPSPAQVIALSPDGPVLSIRWQDQSLTVAACTGPERIAPEWWRDPPNSPHQSQPTRDYFKVQDHLGHTLWLARQIETGKWFVHGLWA